MKPTLSIIVPCYNCSNTLEESIDSIFKQNLKIPFEVVLVDDCSTDTTRELQLELQKKYPEIKIVCHDKNRGGGYTRNTAVKNSVGDVILCFDSDDILIENTVQKMYDLLIEKKADGVTFSGGLSFTKDIRKNKKYEYPFDKNTPIQLEDYLNGKSGGVESNFMYTRNAFELAGGYPIHHNFDTQGFGRRFLLKGLNAFVSPETFFYHRQFTGDYSYFERAYYTGELSIGQFLINLEMFPLLKKETQEEILNFDIFKQNKLGDKNISDSIMQIYQKKPEDFFIENYKNYLIPNGMVLLINTDNGSLSAAYKLISESNYTDALCIIRQALQDKKSQPANLYFLYLFLNFLSISDGSRLNHFLNLLKQMNPQIIHMPQKRNNIVFKILTKLINRLIYLRQKIS